MVANAIDESHVKGAFFVLNECRVGEKKSSIRVPQLL